MISRGSKDGSVACGKSVSIFTRLPSRGVPGFVPTPSVLARIGPGTMGDWPRPAAVARAVPSGVGKVKPRPVRSFEPVGVGAARLAVPVGICVVFAAGSVATGSGAGVLVDAVFVKCTSLDLPINHCKAASSRP